MENKAIIEVFPDVCLSPEELGRWVDGVWIPNAVKPQEEE